MKGKASSLGLKICNQILDGLVARSIRVAHGRRGHDMRLRVRVIVWLLLVGVCTVGMGLFRSRDRMR